MKQTVITERWTCDLCDTQQSQPAVGWVSLDGCGEVCPSCWGALYSLIDDVVQACGLLKISANTLVESVVIARGQS